MMVLLYGALARELGFFNGYGTVLTGLDTGLTAQAVFHLHGIGLAILHFIDISGADISAFTTANTFVLIDGHIVGHSILQKKDKVSGTWLLPVVPCMHGCIRGK